MPLPDLYTWSPHAGAENVLGAADYSYEFVLRNFMPMLGNAGHRVARPDDAPAGSILLSFAPPHRTPDIAGVRVLPVFAWEFDRLPDEPFGGDERNDWTVPLARCGAAITHSQFAVAVTRQAMGDDFPIVSLPAPLWDNHVSSPRAKPPLGGELSVTGIVVDSRDPGATQLPQPHRLTWDGPLFTAVLNPEDGRKNWPDLLSAFVFGLRDEADATLLIKIVHSDVERGAAPLVAELSRLGRFSCRVILVQAFLPDDAYRSLIESSTFAVNASRGEGQCLPLMEFMSAGNPAVAPDHTAMADYVSAGNALVVPSGREPSAWPQDPRLLYTCHRRAIDWGALVSAFQSAHRIATQDSPHYIGMSAAAVEATRAYCSTDVVRDRLEAFLAQLGWGGGS